MLYLQFMEKCWCDAWCVNQTWHKGESNKVEKWKSVHETKEGINSEDRGERRKRQMERKKGLTVFTLKWTLKKGLCPPLSEAVPIDSVCFSIYTVWKIKGGWEMWEGYMIQDSIPHCWIHFVTQAQITVHAMQNMAYKHPVTTNYSLLSAERS